MGNLDFPSHKLFQNKFLSISRNRDAQMLQMIVDSIIYVIKGNKEGN